MIPGEFGRRLRRQVERREAAGLRAKLEGVPSDEFLQEPHFLGSQPDLIAPSFVDESDPDDALLAEMQGDMREIERDWKRIRAGEQREEQQRELAAFEDRLAEKIADRLERA